MARYARTQILDAFASEGDFNEQLYHALRQSPWWMTSVALHVLVFFILTLFDTSDASAGKKALVMHGEIAVDEPETEVEKPAPDEANVEYTEMPVKDPVPKDEPLDDVDSTDNNLPTNEALGDEGTSDAPFEGPSENGSIGIGPGAGSAFGKRGGHRDGKRGDGGGKVYDEAVEDALRWLAAHQSPDGGWGAATFDQWCDRQPVTDPTRRPGGLGKALYDPGVTGLALCAFLGAGYTNRGRHPFAKVVSRGLRYLKNIQDPEGCYGPRTSQQYIYNHATAALAMVEAYGMTASPIWKTSAQKGLDFIAMTRNPYFAWRYGIKPGDNDTSVSGWMMMAIKSAKLINEDAKKRHKAPPLLVDESALDGMRAWLDKVTDPDYGRVGYVQRGTGPARPHDLVDRFPNEKSESMTAVGVLARCFMGEDPRKSSLIQKGADLMAKLPPTWNKADGSIDMYYWYYATLAMFQVGGKHWAGWLRAMRPSMVETQRKDTDACLYKGSWDPVGPWGLDGGRVYSTAIMALCMEVFYRYDRVAGTR